MKRYLTTLVFVFTTAVMHGQSSSQKEVAAAVDRLHKAMIAGDKAGLTGIAVDSLSYGHSGGLVENRDQYVERIVSGKSGWVSIDITEQTITISGKTAIVRHILTGKTIDSGKPGEVHLRIMQVWQKVKGGWKLFGRQAIKIV
ncbi:MAG: nuclear transport factor 2 family protein [Chitinophagaceae bacterium]|nr:MAG: nuclear transport factor 2 family protein [Chitinophagaceae bacterium]